MEMFTQLQVASIVIVQFSPSSVDTIVGPTQVSSFKTSSMFDYRSQRCPDNQRLLYRSPLRRTWSPTGGLEVLGRSS